MSAELISAGTSSVAKPFDPTGIIEKQAKANAVVDFAARVKNWPLVEEAIDQKIEDQREFVLWWDGIVRPPGNQPNNAGMSYLAVDDACDLTGITQQQVSRWRKGLADVRAYRDRLIKAARRKAELEPRVPPAERTIIIPDGTYSTIVIDPPWAMEKIERDERPRQYGFDYPTMTEKQLEEFEPVKTLAAPDCHLFCWTTQKFLPVTLRLFEKWGFRYVFTGVWHKPGGFQPFNLPQYNCEFWVYGRKGSPQFIDTKGLFCCCSWPRREHSRKPDEFYDVIRRVTDGPRIDMFSREKRDGFDQFGNEVGKFAA